MKQIITAVDKENYYEGERLITKKKLVDASCCVSVQAHPEQGEQKGEHRGHVGFPGWVNRAWVKQWFAIKNFPFIILALPLGILFTYS